MLSRNTLAIAVRHALAVSATALMASSPALAQSTGGSVFGQAASGDTVIVEGEGTGFRREISVGADGSYRVPALSPGRYRITLRHADGTTVVRDSVLVSAGTGTPVTFVTASDGALTLENIVVTGVRVNPIDVSSVESVTILSADQLSKIPVLRDLTSAALLAPGAVRGDFAFADGKLPSFGGSSVAENQYYVNGFNVTNSFRGLNFSKIPFEAIAEQQVKTGGYGAEFGRSLGGVVSQTTKRGTNEFQSGSSIYWTPGSLRAKTRNAIYSNPLEPSSLGTVRSINAEEETGEWTANVWASGALVKDKLFAFALIGYSEHEEDRWGNVTQANNTNDKTERPSWLVKLDWHINDANSFELTGFSDQEETTSKVYLNTLGAANRLGLIGTQYEENGGTNVVGKYTSYITDSFTVSALYGYGEYSRGLHLTTADGRRVAYSGDLNTPASGCPVIVDARAADRRAATGTYASTCNITATFPNLGNIEREDARDERNQLRIDAEWELGAHLLRFGYDLDDFESVAGESIEGGRQWRYSTATIGGVRRDTVREQIVNQGATVEVKQRAFYIEDNWNITENFLLSAGLRWDSFENLNGQGETYVEIDNQFGPRLGFSWDVKGDSSMKVYGNAGRYALPLTASVAIRGASASLFTREDYFFTGVDPVTGTPLGLVSRNNFRYVNGEFGEPKNAQTIASKNLDPMYQDEFILGVQMRITNHQNIGARAIYRELKAAIDDNCDYTAILTTEGFTLDEEEGVWFDANGRAADLPNAGFPFCRMFNPGEDAIFLTDLYGDGTLKQTTVDGDLLSPKARRTYKALELFWDGNWDRTFMQATYTLAYSKGNTEGGVKSDIGQDDTNVTQDFDYKELAVDSYGYLPNDRRHSLKLFGSYSFTDEFAVGTNLLVQSGRPKNCLGVLYPYHGDIHPYGSSFFRCGTTLAGGQAGPSEPRPRGTAGRLPWTYQVDLSVAYTPTWAEGLTAKMDVFNVFNKQEAIAVDDRAEDGATGAPVSTYLVPRAFQSPREFQFSLVYHF
ncbi:TonB-dependent receptor [Steroidobacter agaridevorans]|uniref:TonB-dependent receptor n=1 Tax=Steroidobacter agaridevorans TaxID=2695856 RepID=UPI00137AB898|nr:TonB-dependent receptor [Steroidobacter agaridevorans]